MPLADAAAMIRSGEVEAAVAGGADAPITPLTLASFIGSGLVAASNGEPEAASKPFDLTRESGVLAEGAGIFILENSNVPWPEVPDCMSKSRASGNSGTSIVTNQHQGYLIRWNWHWPTLVGR